MKIKGTFYIQYVFILQKAQHRFQQNIDDCGSYPMQWLNSQ